MSIPEVLVRVFDSDDEADDDSAPADVGSGAARRADTVEDVGHLERAVALEDLHRPARVAGEDMERDRAKREDVEQGRVGVGLGERLGREVGAVSSSMSSSTCRVPRSFRWLRPRVPRLPVDAHTAAAAPRGQRRARYAGRGLDGTAAGGGRSRPSRRGRGPARNVKEGATGRAGSGNWSRRTSLGSRSKMRARPSSYWWKPCARRIPGAPPC